jgi:poly(beta-D-mannuronate) C5 epimerase
MALVSSAMAQGGNEAARIAEEARQAFLSAEQGNANAKQRASFYQIARARLKLLEKFADQGASGSAELRDEARAELNRLADDGLSHDVLSSMLLQASIGDLAGPQNGADRMEIGVALHQLASEQRSPAYRAAAFIEVAYAYLKAGAQDRALRYASLALETAGSIPETGAQAGAYRAVARLSAGLGAPGTALVNRAIGLIPRARDQAYARHELAREQLKGGPLEKTPEAKLKLEARKHLEAGDLPGATSLALALTGGKDRDDLLSDLVVAAIKRQDQDIALVAAQGLFEPGTQQKAIAAIVKDYAGRGVPLRAAEIVNSIESGPGKISIQLALAAELKRAGYDGMADRLFAMSFEALEATSESVKQALLPDVVRALTRSERLSEASRYAERLDVGSEASALLSDLAKRLADQERVADAEALLPRIVEKNHRSHALSGIGRAKAKAADIAGAMQVIPELTDDEDIGRVLAALVRVQARAADFAKAMALTGQIKDADYQSEALTAIVKQAVREQNKDVGGRTLEEVIRFAETRDAAFRDKAFLTIVQAHAENGSKGQADELKQRIGDEKLRSRADELITYAEAREAIQQKKSVDLPDALLKRSLGKVVNDEDKAELASELASLPEGTEQAAELIRSISDDRARRNAFRSLAEARADHLMDLSDEEGADRPSDVETVASVSGEAGETVQEIQTRRGIALITAEGAKSTTKQMQMPRDLATSAAVRASAPWPVGTVVGSTFASHNPYIAKFLEDGADGATRLEQAIRYQGLPSPKIIVIQSGVATLGMVARQLQGTDARDLIGYENDALTVRAPIFVAPGATLILSRLDAPTYRLSASAGAFIANAGHVQIIDAEIVGYDEKAGQPLWSDSSRAIQFRPFLLTWGDGRMDVASSALSALGYDNAKSFGLSYSSGPDQVSELRDQARPTGVIVDSVFRNFYFGFHSYEAERIQVVGNEFRNSIVYALDAHDRSKDITIALNTAYGTMLRHGITISREVDGGRITGNLSFDNAGSGAVVDRNSTNNVLQANSSFRNAQDGVTVFESSCNLLSNNYLAGNKRDGLKVRNSVDVGAYGNRIVANANSGVSAYIANISSGKSGDSQGAEAIHFTPVTGLSLRNNRFSSNGVGINAQGVSGLALFANRFIKQSRRLLGGDVRGLEGPVLRLASQSDVLIASTCRPAKPVVSCRLRDQGLFDDGADLQIFNPQGSSNCTDVNGTVQQKAFSSTSQGT